MRTEKGRYGHKMKKSKFLGPLLLLAVFEAVAVTLWLTKEQ